MPRLMTGEMNNKLYVAMEVALVCWVVHKYMKDTDMVMKAILTGGAFALYEMYLEEMKKTQTLSNGQM